MQTGGKGSVRRKKRSISHGNSEDKKVLSSLKKLGLTHIKDIDEVDLFMNDGNVVRFNKPKGKNQIKLTSSNVPTK